MSGVGAAAHSAQALVGPLPDAVVFDLDGTLVDTETISDDVLVDVLATLGHQVTGQDLLAARGRAFSWLRQWLWDRFEVAEEDYRRLAGPAWEHGLADGVPTFPDTMALLDRLTDLGVPLALCTSSGRGHMERVLDAVGIADRFVARVSATDVANHKPDPEPYAMAVDLLDVAPGTTVAIEDTVVGATAAVAAGLRVVGRPHPGTADMVDVVHLQVQRVDLDAIRTVMAGVE